MASEIAEFEALFQPQPSIQAQAHVKSLNDYKQLYEESISDPESFWRKIYEQFYWKNGPTGEFFKYNFDVQKGPISIKWMEGAKTNIAFNVLDRNVNRGLGEKTAFFWYATIIIIIIQNIYSTPTRNSWIKLSWVTPIYQ